MNPAGAQPEKNSEREAFFAEKLNTSLTAFRAGFLGIARRSPAEIEQLIRKLPEDQAHRVMVALAHAEETGRALEPLIRLSDREDHRPEVQRPPHEHEPQRIEPHEVLVLSKRSKYEIDRGSDGSRSDEDLKREYLEQELDFERIKASHEAHIDSYRTLERLLGEEATFRHLHDLLKNPPALRKLLQDPRYKLIVSHGGDDTVKPLSHFITDQLVVAFNSDEHFSNGALTSHTRQGYGSFFEGLARGNFVIEEWARIQSSLEIPGAGGIRRRYPPLAINELGAHDRDGDYTMRGLIYRDGKIHTELKGTGLLIATGAGSTGWYTSATPHLFVLGRKFLRTKQELEFVEREGYRFHVVSIDDLVQDPKEVQLNPGVLGPGDELIITSSSNHDPIVSADSAWRHAFRRGARLRARLSDQPLKVVRERTGLHAVS